MMQKNNLSPIIIFAFNRPEAVKLTVSALQENPEAKVSDLYVFVDGARSNREMERKKVLEVQEYVKSIKGFKSVTYKFSKTKKGLGPSIISGVSEVFSKHDKVIVLEDDLIVRQNFLSFMNQGLTEYKNNPNVWSICGYSNKVRTPSFYNYDAYFCTRSSSWGWGTWVDRWNSVDWTFNKWDIWKKSARKFNRWGGSDCFGMLNDCRLGKNKSWAIRFCFNQFIQNTVSLFPKKSLVTNDGFDGEGTNCKKYSRFKFELMPEYKNYFQFPSSTEILPIFKKQCLKYSSISRRVWSRLMYMLYW